MLFKKIYLLVWKNFIFRKGHLCATVWLIILPMIVALIVRVILANLENFEKLMNGIEDQLEKPLDKDKDIHIKTDGESYGSYSGYGNGYKDSLDIAFTPANDKTKRIMEGLKNALLNLNNRRFSKVKLIIGHSEAALESVDPSINPRNKFQFAIIFQSTNEVYSYKLRIYGIDFFTESLLLHPKMVDEEKGFQLKDKLPKNPKKLYDSVAFRTLQICLDRLIVQENLQGATVPKVKIYIQEFPSRPPTKKAADMSKIVPHVIILSFILCVPNIIRGIIHEKQSGIKELMKMMGLSNWMHWTGWMIDSLFFLIIILILMTIILFEPAFGDGAISHCNATMWFFILLLYLIATMTFLFFISTFFIKPTLAIIGGLCFFIVSYYGLVFVLDSDDIFASTLAQKLASSLLPNMALHWALKIILDREFRGAAIGWSNFTEPFSAVDNLNLLDICVMLLVDIILYMLLTVYMESVIPSEFGLAKPWYYPFQLSTWYSRKKVIPVDDSQKKFFPVESDDFSTIEPTIQHGFEEEPSDLTVGIEICNLVKKFGNRKVAVDGLSAKMYCGEITALLGHNGAGKTTTLSILTGLYKPSSGAAFINGHNIVNQIGEARKSMGLCPQHDLLFDELTVAQHLQFFGMLKGLSSSTAKQDADRILCSLKLGEKAKSLASTLSGGQKRRLSLANSIVGGSSVLILDEPTSGLDPEARREVWDLLLALRTEGRTIVLTTHFMEEADVLGDRILIMAEGKLQCSGTPLFLKKSFGDGYTLTVTLTDKADKNTVLSVVQKYISTASFKEGKDKSSSEAAITLPEESTQTSIFPDMFSDLTKNQQKLGIVTMGLAIPSMDDVFLRVGELSHPTDEIPLDNAVEATNVGNAVETSINVNAIETSNVNAVETSNVNAVETSNGNNFESVKGPPLFTLKFQGLMVKLFIRNFRNIRLVLLQLLPPIAGAVIVAILSSLIFSVQIHEFPPLKISLESYDDPITLCMPISPAEEDICNNFFETTEGIGTTRIVHPDKQNPDLVTFLINEGNSNDKESKINFKMKYIIAAEILRLESRDPNVNNALEIKVMHSGTYCHSEPLALNAASNTILKIGGKKKSKIEITNHPIRPKPPSFPDLLKTAEENFADSWAIVIIFDVLLSLPFAMLAATYLMFPSEERVCKGKHLQLMTGVSPLLYWTTSFLLDVFKMVLVFCAILICFSIFQSHELFTADSGTGMLFVICMVYAFSVIPLSYLRSNFLPPSQGFSGLVILHGFTALLITNLAFIFELFGEIKIAADTDEDQEKIIKSIFNTIYALAVLLRMFFIANPTFGLTMCFLKFAAISVENNRCKLLDYKIIEQCTKADISQLQYLRNLFGEESLLKSCCIPCPDVPECGYIKYCYGKLEYLTWKFESSYIKVRLSDKLPFTKISCDDADKMPGIGQELFWMFFFGVFYYILLFMMEYGVLARMKNNIVPPKSLVAFQANYPTDEDVIAEAGRVCATVNPQPQPVNRFAIYDLQNVAPPQIISRNADEIPNIGDNKNDDAVKSDEQHQMNQVAAIDKQDAVEMQIEQDSLVVQNLCKSYGSFAAVSNISFGVKHGECFGLLGVNGAGKTTTFRMLTGDEFPSDGDAFIGNISLKKDRNNFISQFGYCPQFDPLIGFMTGREMLNFYGRLRGVPSGSLKNETSKWLDKLGLTGAGNLQCKTYSEGMKRRLSAGVAMIGNPQIVLLDEPTSGVDPVSRRKFWKVISSVKDAGQAVIFTSHSMDECEALCSRLGIMVNGQFQCFGGAPHLKKKFGEGYTLTIKLKSNIPVDNSETDKLMDNSKAVTDLQDVISAKYQQVFLKEVHSNIMQYQLLDGSMNWDVVFKIMEEIKAGHEIIDVYSIGETTLEQVFLTFARQQHAARVI